LKRAGVEVVIMVIAIAIVAGCSENKSTTQPSTADQALSDPFNYSPSMGKTDISGGGLGNYDKDAMKKDIDHVFNP
jgi:hypothetical protein